MVVLLAAWVGLFLSSYGLFLLCTEPLAIYAHVPRSAIQWLIAAALVAPCYLAAAWATKRWWPLLWVAAIVGFVVFLLPASRRERVQFAWASCANHSGQWFLPLERYIEGELGRDPQSLFPASTKIDALMTAIIKAGHLSPYAPGGHSPEQEEGERWSWYCPGRGRSTQPDTGYVYVAGGLPMKRVMEKGALIALCAAGCHPWPNDHEHAFVGDSLTRHCCTGPEMLRLIERALQQAESGEVPYSPEAVLLLERELAARRELPKQTGRGHPEEPGLPHW